MAKILVNYPTRSRPQKFIKILGQYIQRLSNIHQVHFLIKVDRDDVLMNNTKMQDFVKRQNISYTFDVLDNCKGKIDAINRNVSQHDFDIVLSIADDMEVLEQDWDDRIVQDMGSELNSCLNYNSDPRLQDFTSLIVLPIIGRKLYDQFGYIYHPAYISEYCDDEQTAVFTRLGAIKHIDHHLFKHDWWGNQDKLMERNMRIGVSVDKQTFETRKANGFV